MPDPFEALRAPVTPVDPNPAFARRLRARVERALDLPEGVTVSNLDLDLEEPRAMPDAGAAIPYLAVADARAAIDWYVEVFGARLYDEPIVMPDGRVGHANVLLGTGILYLADEFEEIGHRAPAPDTTSVSLGLRVDDVDATVEAAVAAGATLLQAPDFAHGSRRATIVDPFGHRWMLDTPTA